MASTIMMQRQIYWTDNNELCSRHNCLMNISSSSTRSYIRISSINSTEFVVLQVDNDKGVEDEVVLVPRWVADILDVAVGSVVQIEVIGEGMGFMHADL